MTDNHRSAVSMPASPTKSGIARAFMVLGLIHDRPSQSNASALVRQTGLPATTVRRILATLKHEGAIVPTGNGYYRSTWYRTKTGSVKIGYCGQSQSDSFALDVAASVQRAATEAGFRLIQYDNQYSPDAALRNVKKMIQEKVDVAIEFQTFASVSTRISKRLDAAQIPLIAVDIPHPGAAFFGADNTSAGRYDGVALGRFAKEQWDGQADALLLITLRAAGDTPQQRIEGIKTGVRSVLKHKVNTLVIDANGTFESGLRATRRVLRSWTKPVRVLLSGINDPSVLGALAAFEEAGRQADCIAVGQNATSDARAALKIRGKRFFASVAYYPERYGTKLIKIARQILADKTQIRASEFTTHKLITRTNIDQEYAHEAGIR